MPTSNTDPAPSTAGKMEGPTPPIAGMAKPANSLQPRGDVACAMIDGPYGGKKPQS